MPERRNVCSYCIAPLQSIAYATVYLSVCHTGQNDVSMYFFYQLAVLSFWFAQIWVTLDAAARYRYCSKTGDCLLSSCLQRSDVATLYCQMLIESHHVH